MAKDTKLLQNKKTPKLAKSETKIIKGSETKKYTNKKRVAIIKSIVDFFNLFILPPLFYS